MCHPSVSCAVFLSDAPVTFQTQNRHRSAPCFCVHRDMPDTTPCGNTLATDHFGATGVAANMDAFTPACFRTDYPNNGFVQKMGNSANQVLSPDLTGNNAVLRSLGVPIALGASSAGSNLFGQDYLYQHIRNELCLRSGASWSGGSDAGVWASYWYLPRTYSSNDVGFRSACVS